MGLQDARRLCITPAKPYNSERLSESEVDAFILLRVEDNGS
jgi:hypothetical protein